MKPLIFYIDDEPRNLTVFEASLPSDWEIKTFSNPLNALEALETMSPWVMVTDQRMPGLSGVRYLELARKLRPNAIRIIVTGFSEEDLVVESVRKAQIFDYIKKPWEPDDLEASIARAVEYYRASEEARLLHQQLVEREALLTKKNDELQKMAGELQQSHHRELELRKELECWAPPFVLLTKETDVKFPMKRDIVGIAYDIIKSSELHNVTINGKHIRSLIIKNFSEALLRNGGWRESHSGDSAYGHFGLLEMAPNPLEAALSAAREFRVSLKSISEVHGINVEVGISLHVAAQSVVDIHNVQVETPRGPIIQKSFDTSSIEIDLLHRMEKLMHQLPGSNIILSGQFVRSLKAPPSNLLALGANLFKGQTKPVDLYLIPSFKTTEEDLRKLKAQLTSGAPDTAKAA